LGREGRASCEGGRRRRTIGNSHRVKDGHVMISRKVHQNGRFSTIRQRHLLRANGLQRRTAVAVIGKSLGRGELVLLTGNHKNSIARMFYFHKQNGRI
jgi:hypothetical protein